MKIYTNYADCVIGNSDLAEYYDNLRETCQINCAGNIGSE